MDPLNRNNLFFGAIQILTHFQLVYTFDFGSDSVLCSTGLPSSTSEQLSEVDRAESIEVTVS